MEACHSSLPGNSYNASVNGVSGTNGGAVGGGVLTEVSLSDGGGNRRNPQETVALKCSLPLSKAGGVNQSIDSIKE